MILGAWDIHPEQNKDPNPCGHYILVVLFAFPLDSFPTLFSTTQKQSLSLDMILIVP